MYKAIFFLIINLFCHIINIYTLQVQGIDGGSIDFSDYKGKKLLLINKATASEFASQLTAIDDFYQKNKDSIMVISFPSNQFNNEANTNDQLRSLVKNIYHVTFPIAEKSPLPGEDANVIYRWLGSKEQNGEMGIRPKGDFEKVLINRT